MHPVALLLLKGLMGGLGVIAFTALARMVRPQRLAGVFCASPSIAVGSLAVVVLTSNVQDGLLAAKGMAVGAAALVGGSLIGALVARPAEGSAVRVSIATSLAWLALAALIAVVAW